MKSVAILTFAGVVAASAFAGCSHNTPSTPQAFISSSLIAGANKNCQEITQTWFDVGTHTVDTDGSNKYKLVPDGQNDDDGDMVNVTCSVTPGANGAFNVDAQAVKANVGTFRVTGTFATDGTQTNVTGHFQKTAGTFDESDCTVTYPQDPMGVASGRVWGEIVCPMANFPAQQQTCEAQAEFRFENCSQ